MLRNRTPHNHSFFEIMIVLSGEIEQIIEGQHIIYREGEACILNKSIRHFERGGSMFEALFIDLSDTILEQVLNDASASPCGMGLEDALKGVSHLKRLNEKKKYYNAKEYIDFRPVEDAGGSMRSDILLSHVNDLAMETIDYGVGSSFITTGLISRIMHALGSESLYRQTYMNIADGKEEAILGKAISLMEASCGRISRDELAKELHYNSDYLNRIVKKYTGKPIGELSRFLLLERAKELILSQDSSISQIAQDLGFTNRTYFYRIFEKECHMTPNEYRLRNGSS
jgi:AraC-like DNA-binding protein